MNELLELWSVPWHALQRSLADSFGAQAAEPMPFKAKLTNARIPAAVAGSWLGRARDGTRSTGGAQV